MTAIRAGLAVIAMLACAIRGSSQTQEAPEPALVTGTVRVATAPAFMVAAAHPLAVEAGRAILAEGGSAADAAVAIQLVLGLVEPQSSGLGGGSFALHWSEADRELTSLDGRETAPQAAGPDLWLLPDGTPRSFAAAVPGGLSVGVPGTLALLHELHRRHGRLPWADLFAPAIRLADDGFPVSPRLAAAIADAALLGLALFPGTEGYFLGHDHRAPDPGTRLRNPDYARTLRLIAAAGPGPFYEGAIAGDIVAAVRDAPVNPGLMRRADLAAYRVVERPPVCQPYRLWVVCGMGPPSSGGIAVGQILGLLARFDLAALGDGAAAWHLFAEASRLALADRALYLADPDFVAVPGTLLDPGYLAARAALIDPARAMIRATAGTPPSPAPPALAPDRQTEPPGTTHLVVRDRYGDAVSLTSSIETGFGSRLMTGGFLLNNELTDFSFLPVAEGRPVANRVEGGKRPRSSMAPTIVLRDGVPVLMLGAPGGPRLIAFVAATLVRILDFGMDPATALAEGHIAPGPDGVMLEAGTAAEALRPALEALGHRVRTGDLNSGVHLILVTPDGLVGAADPRREGDAAGG